ncbi:MAG TPA: carboxyl transferase domain-containing protein, partial [Candidatus Dormibacteraeota bacterium]|nr:carboxyl transferase domain-containing protein [Candidatus Dormibacteraeota bacterium]
MSADATLVEEAERAAIAAVDLARHPDRPRALRVISGVFDGWEELRGDRLFGDDPAVMGGPARLGERSVMVIAQEKGVDAQTRAHRNFGMPHPEGYRKAMRLMRLAERFSLPVICLVDTPAAHPGVGAEERGQAWAIAESLCVMLELRVPTISAILSEGGSGGALALAVA